MSDSKNARRTRSLINVFREYPVMAQAIGGLHHEIMRQESVFSEGERELIAALVSALNGCTFCAGIHGAAAEAFGIEPGLLAELVENIDTASVDDSMKPVLRFVAKLAMHPSQLVAEDSQAMLAAGWDEKAVHDAVCVCALYSFMNRYADGTGLEAAPDEFRLMGQQIAAHRPPE